MKLYEIFSGKELEIAEKINRRRYQILVHSYLYYDQDTNLVSDSTFDSWEVELVNLQHNYPEIAEQVPWHDAFKGWEGSTGAFLPYKDERIVAIGNRLIHKKSSKIIMPTKPIVSKSKAKPAIKHLF